MRYVRTLKRWGALPLVAVGVVVGSVIGPPIVRAASTIVTIQGTGTTNRAAVTDHHRLRVDTEAGVKRITTLPGENGAYLRVATQPGGGTVVDSGVADSPFTLCAVMTAISVDGGSAGTVSLSTDGGRVWEGTLPAGGGHIGDSFPDGVFTGEMLVDDPAGLTWIVYGRGC